MTVQEQAHGSDSMISRHPWCYCQPDVSSSQGATRDSPRSPRRSRNEGARRAEILAAAIDRFGRNGYDGTKWADIADDVGIGPTALYHYFDSNQHCLYVILEQGLKDVHGRFDAITATHTDPLEALLALCTDSFELSERDVLRNRVLVAEQALLSHRGSSPCEEEARQAGLVESGALEIAWSQFLAHAMEQGAIPEQDPRMLTRAILGLYNSIWEWYRTDQSLLLPTVAEFFVARMLAIAGMPPEAVESVSAA